MRTLRRFLPWPLVIYLAATAVSAESVAFDRMSSELVQQRLALVPRKLADRRAALENLFHEVGCSGDEFSEQAVRGTKAPNLICTLPGDSGQTIVVGGHYDSIEQGMGAVDDWSGAALLPSLYQSLKSKPRRHRFLFIGFAGEEAGLYGSSQFVRGLKRTEIQGIRAMINLECLGVELPKVWASRADRNLLNLYAQVASAIHVETRGVNVDKVGDDDSHPFLSAGVAVLTIHSLTQNDLPLLHNKKDVVAAINPDHYYVAYQVAVAYLAYLDQKLD